MTETTEYFFTVNANAISVVNTETTTNSITVKIDKSQFKFGNKTLSYDIEVWKYTPTDLFSGTEGWSRVNDKCKTNVTPNIKGYVSFDGLEAGVKYGFILVVHVNADEGEGRSSATIQGSTANDTTKMTLPAINNLVVAAKGTNETGKIAINSTSDGILINGVDLKASTDYDKYYDPAGVLTQLQTAISSSNLKAGDKITYSDLTLTVDLTSHATSGTERDLGTYNGITLKVVNNNFKKQLKGIVKEGNVVLSGENGIFDISTTGFTVDEDYKVLLENGVNVTLHGTNKATIAAGATVTVCGVEINTDKELLVSGTSTALAVTPNGDGNATFTSTSTTQVTITYDGLENWTSVQNGKITLVSDGGDIKLAGDNVSLQGEIEAILNNGKVDLTDIALVGSKDVKVTVVGDAESSEIKAIAANKVPSVGSTTKVNQATFTNYELKDMTANEIKTFFGGTHTEVNSNAAIALTDEEAIEVKSFLDSFELNDLGVKLSKSAATQEVTLTFSKECSNVSVKGLK